MFYWPNYVAATAFFQDASGSVGRLRVRRATDWDFVLGGVTVQLIYWAKALSDASLVRANAYTRVRAINPSPPTGRIGREVTLVFNDAIIVLPVSETLATLPLDQIEDAIETLIDLAELATYFGDYLGLI